MSSRREFTLMIMLVVIMLVNLYLPSLLLCIGGANAQVENIITRRR